MWENTDIANRCITWKAQRDKIKSLCDKSYDLGFASNKNSDQPWHLLSLIRVFAVALLVAEGLSFLYADSEDFYLGAKPKFRNL